MSATPGSRQGLLRAPTGYSTSPKVAAWSGGRSWATWGIALDITKADGRALLARLAETADIVLESFAPGYLEGLGLGYRALSRINRAPVLTSITPFGQEGPYAHYQATDIVSMAIAWPT